MAVLRFVADKLLTIVLPALVTGGGTGIGKAIASALVQNGAKVYIAARKEPQLKEVRASVWHNSTVNIPSIDSG
jgi:NADP-dependent 3-hydroxy acid dehydrogenase YdfG